VVKLFQNWDGNDDVMFIKLMETGTVVEYDIGIEDKDFLLIDHIW
jgi:hypothetical protein